MNLSSKMPGLQQHGFTSYEVSANEFIEAQTKQIEREFRCSRPRPRNRAMGFKEIIKPKRPYHEPSF